MTTSKLLLLIAVICFILAAIGLSVGSLSIGWLGLAAFSASGLVG